MPINPNSKLPTPTSVGLPKTNFGIKGKRGIKNKITATSMASEDNITQMINPLEPLNHEKDYYCRSHRCMHVWLQKR